MSARERTAPSVLPDKPADRDAIAVAASLPPMTPEGAARIAAQIAAAREETAAPRSTDAA